jgi:hypothetical protein
MLIIGAVREAVLPPGPTVDDVLHPVEEARPRLTRGEVVIVLRAAGWEGELLEQAVEVAWCESRWQPAARNGDAILGLFQLWGGWFPWAGEDLERWADPVVNARTARRVVERDVALGRGPWAQWACRPSE